jgi:NAD(P)-dependent dehydrogenase (short-subunit alcohol dehydrogenase family)
MELLKNKTCIITGGNSGIGKAAAVGLARFGANIILVVRNRFRGEAALKEIITLTGNKNIEIQLCCLSSFESIKECADNIRSHHKKIDMLINNAGAYFSKKHITKDGIEATFQVNYLSRFLLTNLLLDLIAKNGGGKIIIVNGEYHRHGKINFNDLQMENRYTGMCAACRAKLADLLFVYELSSKLKGFPVNVNALHPGIVATNAVENDPDASMMRKILYWLAKPFLSSPEKGAETILYLASNDEVKNVTGKYFINKKIAASSSSSLDKEAAKKLWKESEILTGVDTEQIFKKLFNE